MARLAKNEVIEVTVDSMGGDGAGVCRHNGAVVFVPGGVAGDIMTVRIIKEYKNYYIGKIEQITVPSPERAEPGCPAAAKCGGCAYRSVNYEFELIIKRQTVADALTRLGGVDTEVTNGIEIVPSPKIDRYRNKAQYPFAVTPVGRACVGLYAPHSHRVVPLPGHDCLLQPEIYARISETVLNFVNEYNIPVYDEGSHTGLLRHLYIRSSAGEENIAVCLVINGGSLPRAGELVKRLTAGFPGVKSVSLSVNRERTNVVMGDKTVVLHGENHIEDTLCGLRFRISLNSFYQVNRGQTENLYNHIAELIMPYAGGVLLDLYCGVGTIGLCASRGKFDVMGVEIVPEAVTDARANASLNGIGSQLSKILFQIICGRYGFVYFFTT